MWVPIDQSIAKSKRAIYVNVIWICILCVGIGARTYERTDLSRNNSTFVGKGGFTQKKARSAQYGGFLPGLRTVYPRQSVPVRLTTIPVNGGYRLPIAQKFTNVAPLAQLPSLQRAYVPVIGSVPSMRYPVLRTEGLTNRYVVPYKNTIYKLMPAQGMSATPQENEALEKHYNEKYNTLPTVSNADLTQDGLSLPRKTETKQVDIGDDFDNFLTSLDGPCTKNSCQNGAKCRISSEGNSYHCICKRGYKGKNCEDKNECFPNPCENNGECTLTNEGFECSCPKSFKGKKCEQRNTCEPNPCQHDGICTELTNGAFECTCKKGHFGDKCQVSKQGCSPNPCQNNGHCREKDNGGYECMCGEGYTGTNCDRPKNKCFINPCKNGGSCMQAMTSLGYECACARGFRGTNCEDHSGCDITSCQNGGTCYETEFGVRCICKNGYSGDKCQIRKFCEADTCQNNGKCIEHARGFRCVCPEGYKGKMCDEIDRCRPNPCLHGGHCEQSDTGYFCKCSAQYQGQNCEVSNPCASIPCKNGGKCTGTLDGQQFQCQCLDGYLGRTCEERNFCAPNPCENNGMCRSTPSEFVCQCRDGFQGKTCSEKDPCQMNPCLNNGICTRNGNSDYTCTCADDYKGKRCEVKRHCRPNPCLNYGVCQESENDFTCSCKEGFRGQRCEEQDQCAPNPCRNGGRCVSAGLHGNARGFICECANSFYGDTCEERNPCHPNPCGNDGQCTEINGGFTCQCRAGYKGDRCHEIDKCNPNPCQHAGSCTEIIGGLGYACKCPYGYKGQDCERKDYCHPNPCDHDGQCTPVDNEAGYKCKCAPGYMGQRCSDPNPCEPNPCNHNGQCVLFPGFGKNHECNCTIGWSGDTCEKREICRPNPCQFGTKCVETGEDSYSCVKSMCHPNPCQNSGKCINVNQNNFQCACTSDYEGRTCTVPRKHSQLSLVPPSPPSIYSQRLPAIPAGTPPSLQQTASPSLKSGKPPNIPMSAIASCSPFLCQNGGVCVQEAGKAIRCKCTPMYTGETCQMTKCEKNPCGNNGTCIAVDREPGFVCKCKDGLTGPLCSRKPCEPNPCLNDGQCVMFYSIYLCKCKPGFKGKLCEESSDGRIVAPKKVELKPALLLKANKAVSPCSPSPCKNNARCVETSDGEFECICSEEFSGPRCEDKGKYKYSSARKFFPGYNEECKHCDRNARCVNGHCVCRNKYVGDGLECWERTEKDVNWKCDPNPCKNGGTCKEGRSACVCRLGFVGDYCEEFSPPVVHLTFDKLSENSKIIDMSGNGNDALVNQGFQIAPKQGKCDNAGNLFGGDVIFDGEHFRSIPRRAITIAVWVKLITALGIQSIFDTVGSHSRHTNGQYHFEIDNGRVRWFHRNEDGKTVFSVVTDQIVVREGNWTLITGTYSADKNRARIYVNGDMIKDAKGHKMLLSGDWGFKAGIGKHEHPYGARILRGMVDEFSIFPSELSRLQILVLMTHCKVYYNNNNKKTSTALKESFSEIKPNIIQSYNQQETAAPYQTQANYYQSPNAPTSPQTSNNVPATYNYQTGYNAGQGYTQGSNYGNNEYQQSANREQTGYQRSQGYKRPSRPNIPGYTKQGPSLSSYASTLPKLSTYVHKPRTQTPSYVPKSPSYTQGSIRTGIPATAYLAPKSTNTYPYTPQSYDKVVQSNRGYPKSYTAQRPVTLPYYPQWSGSKMDQTGYTRTAGSLVKNREPTNIPQYQQNTWSYNRYPTRRYGPSRYYSQSGPGYARNAVYSPSVENTPFGTVPYRAAVTNTASQGNIYSTVPQSATNTEYATAQYAGNIPARGYQSIVPVSGQQGEQYGPLTNQYSAGVKSSIPQNGYQTGNRNPSWGNDVTRQMTSASDVTSTSYGLQSSTQNGYPRNDVYANNFKNYQASNGYNPAGIAVSRYATQSITPEYGPNYAYTAGLGMDRSAVRGNIPRPKFSRVKSSTAHVTNPEKVQNLRTLEGLIRGPSPNTNKKLKVHKLDANGQFPSDMKRYNNLVQLNARKTPMQPQNAGVSSSSYMGVKQPAYTQSGTGWSTRSQTPTAWNSGGVAKMGSYDSWSAGLQAQKPRSPWNSGAKVDEGVQYNNDLTTVTSQTTATNAGKAEAKNIDMDNVVNKALTDFLTTRLLRKKKRRKRENELTQTLKHDNATSNTKT